MASFPSFLHLSALALLAFSSLSCAKSYSNISLGSSLTTSGPNTYWLSPSGEFAFGFRPLETDSSSFLLAVWFEKIESKTVAWYPRPYKPVTAGSSVELTTDGQLLLKDRTGSSLWDPGVSNAAYAAMLDTGNFILAGANGSPRWQSFQDPADTMLPSQALELDTKLLSRLTDTDYSEGRFKLIMQNDGNLVLYAVAVPSSFQYDPYWSSDSVGNGTGLIFNQSGSVYLSRKSNTNINITSVEMSSLEDFYQRATLDFDGVFRQYIHPKNGSGNGAWPSDRWTMVGLTPTDICSSVNFKLGSGICGFNSYCTTSDNSSVVCECPPQYSFMDPSRRYKGCKPDFPAQSCDADESEAAPLYGFRTLVDVDWSLSDYEEYSPISEDQCREECLTDCFCALAVFDAGSGSCWKKKIPLSNGRKASDVNRRGFLKIPTDNTSQPFSSTGEEKGKRTWILLGSLFLGVSLCVLMISILLVTYWSFVHNKRLHKRQPSSSLPTLSLRSFTYPELEEATDSFREVLGSGASGVVYKGFLKDEAGTRVAVKKLDKVSRETEKEFMNEVISIGQTYHKNLVRLVGFCCQGTDRLLVYEFMSNGSLMALLSGDVRPSWDQRVQIALGIARGLLYLHEECISQIIHCDIKPQNVLLDDNLVPRISDFGLAKLLKTDQTRTKTDIRGTKGYVAPEWFKNAGVTAKVDVYSFGVMLLEIICCRRNVDLELGEAEEAILTFWANDRFRDGRLDLLVEGDEEATLDMRRVERFVKVALWCIQEEPSMRPTMHKVAQMLDGTVAVPIPPDPSSYISSLQ
ncbi:unnamed protein product [Musa acuminata subsp. burmannicoides]